MSQLFVVAIPIGNSDDVSQRALKTLSEVDVVAAEDTRVFLDFCRAHKINPKRVISYHNHNEKESTLEIEKWLLSGQSVAIVSDAGTPNISDPGFSLILSSVKREIKVIPIPGPSALTAALSVCPIGGIDFYFGGFAPKKESDLRASLSADIFKAHRVIYFESPHRLIQHLELALEEFEDNPCAVFRELTKKYEEISFGTLSELIARFKSHSPKGEIVIIHQGKQKQHKWNLAETQNQIQELLDLRLSSSQIVEQLRSKTTLSKQQLYDIVLELNKK
jgi:16S rRNA (cytidine1402-2'-O)-methyltransferase